MHERYFLVPPVTFNLYKGPFIDNYALHNSHNGGLVRFTVCVCVCVCVCVVFVFVCLYMHALCVVHLGSFARVWKKEE